MYAVLPDAVSGRWLVRDPVKGAFPCPFLSYAVARDFCWLLNTVPDLADDQDAATLVKVRRTGAPLCDC
jgi:hypothetical protein